MFRKSVLFLACAVLLSACCSSGDGYRIKDGVIVFDEPAPAKGQEDMLLFAADPIDTVRTVNISKTPDSIRSPHSQAYEAGEIGRASCRERV